MLTEQERQQLEAMKNDQPIEEEKPNGEGQEGQEQGRQQEELLEAEPAKAEEPKKEEVKKEEPKEHTKVTHAALHEERMKRKEVQRQLQEMQEKFARVDERLKVLVPEKKEEAPNREDDPLGHERFERERLQKLFDERSKSVGEQTEKLNRDMQALQYKSFIERQEMLFERQTPDYQDALKHLVDFRVSVLEDLGVEEDERRNIVQQELANAVNISVEKGKNPAEAVYKMAQKIGYKKKEQEKKLEQIEKGTKATSSLSAAGGKSGGPLTAEALAEMSDEDFKKIDFKDFRKVLGG